MRGRRPRQLSLRLVFLLTLLLGTNACTTTPLQASPTALYPLYRIAVRVHIGASRLTTAQVATYLAEVNAIWRRQAAICFEFEIVRHIQRRQDGFDIFFMPDLYRMNGFHYGDHTILIRDVPVLGPALHAAATTGGRTTAHELGHGLGLDHDERSDNFLMRSGRMGYRLQPAEIRRARRHAAAKALVDTSRSTCGAPVIDKHAG